jgi:hypothetical protein
MSMKFIPCAEIEELVWNELLKLSQANLNYEKYFIEYQVLSYPLKNLSGIVFSNSSPVALYVKYFDLIQNKLSPQSLTPIFFTNNLQEKIQSNKCYSESFETNLSISQNIPEADKKHSWMPNKNIQNYDSKISDKSSELIIELDSPEELLFANLSRNHKRTIKSSIAKGQKILSIDANVSRDEISFYFNAYKNEHQLVAGRETRPKASFDYMEQLISLGISKLFVNVFEESAISFLYCDSSREYARGWSQVTKANLKKGLFPRTLLEWTAIRTYKLDGKSVYHLGSIRNKASDFEFKNLGFDEFKLRFNPTILL